MLKAFKAYRESLKEEQSSLFLEGFATPSKTGGRNPMEPPSDVVAWSEVEKFLQMAEQALKVRTARNEALSKELEHTKSEHVKVEKTSSAALEESSFLADNMQQLLDERAALKKALAKVQQERDYLARENELLRLELGEDRGGMGDDGGGGAQLAAARQQEELRAAQQRLGALEQDNAQLSNQNTQLMARVSALERANQAQSTAMLSCLEESERVRLQQLSINVCESPLGTLAGHRQRSEFTDDSSVGDLAQRRYADLDDSCQLSEASGSYVSCATPLGSTSSAAAAAHASIFRSAHSSPGEQSQQQHGLLRQSSQERFHQRGGTDG